MGIETWFEKSKQILYGIYIISIQGPFPCKAISKIDWKTAKLWVLVHILFYNTIENWIGDEEIRKWNWITVFCRDPFIIFAGGMPRASYGDRHTVTIMQGANNIHTVLDFTSKVVDFITISRADEAEDEMGKWREWL